MFGTTVLGLIDSPPLKAESSLQLHAGWAAGLLGAGSGAGRLAAPPQKSYPGDENDRFRRPATVSFDDPCHGCMLAIRTAGRMDGWIEAQMDGWLTWEGSGAGDEGRLLLDMCWGGYDPLQRIPTRLPVCATAFPPRRLPLLPPLAPGSVDQPPANSALEPFAGIPLTHGAGGDVGTPVNGDGVGVGWLEGRACREGARRDVGVGLALQWNRPTRAGTDGRRRASGN
ncbi:hypothetical protein BDK51DRAFT_37863 [Blyttiomyces helicus]|uniref:Uncharacterized protein n=1 Tax=Blyttiomyces helicus TaxID=388810 RepID=A0A4P9W9V8_9FUNG|nr:hypothetical protein BDK51DRAFT_37863 [Blyttiomyces helicus]|eukprot:RKO89349.1 hypothetical protein BDK51DRAFT_37863 [Blyttiomyces helicus]